MQEQGVGKGSRDSSIALWRAAGLFAASIATSACTINPGLNLSVSGAVPAAPDRVTAEATSDEINKGYRLIIVNSRSIAALAYAAIPRAESAEEAISSRPTEEYRVGPGDVVAITVWEHPELTNPSGGTDATAEGRLIAADGTMFYPYVGDFTAAGMTVNEVRKHIATSLSRVIREPQVDARIIAFRSQRVQVVGQVAAPGMVTLNDTPKGIVDVINERGGLIQESSRRSVTLVRDGQRIKVDQSDILAAPGIGKNPVIKAGDIIEVPDRIDDRVFMLGEVNDQKPVYLHESRTTLIDALTQSGGLDKLRADDSGVLIFRKPRLIDQVPVVFSLNMSNPTGLLLAGEFTLAPQDIVYVKATDFAKYNSIVNQMLPTISAIFQLDRLTSSR